MLELSNAELLELLHMRGYRIVIITTGTSRRVNFTSKYSITPYELPTTFSTKFTNEEVQNMCISKLLSWSGLKVRYTLDY
jgi:hypothetical protein